MTPLAIIAAITVFTAVGDMFLKNSSSSPVLFANKSFLVGLAIYVSTAFLWVFVYRSEKFSLSGAVYSLLTMLLFVGIGVFVYHETLSKTELLGLGFGLISVILLGRYL